MLTIHLAIVLINGMFVLSIISSLISEEKPN